ncbi:MAG: hypothetical protein FAF03_02985 [Epsilonproteobacteria bacterium]|nr:hypothetical protein [Campylobacterota bacterium]
MKKIFFSLFLLMSTQCNAAPENITCKKCHPIIYAEYQNSMHAKASVFKDPVHKAVWDKHPAKAKNNYKCAKCHTPSDHDLISGKSKLEDNKIQQTEPISCQACHTIESIEKHTKINKNKFTKKKKYFFSADSKRKGKKITFKEKHSFFGLMTKTSGSPYHDIDYSNENFYDGGMCLGCHDHKQNGKGFSVCDMQIKKNDSLDNKDTCISCHMPKIKGTFVNLKNTHTHAFHGISIHTINTSLLAKHIKLSLQKTTDGFEVSIENKANHTLFAQPLRLNQLRVNIEREGKTLSLERKNFIRIIGKDGKPAMPWVADSELKNTLIKAHETRTVDYDTPLEKGDTVVIEFGYYLVNPKAAKKLNITDELVTEFIILTRKRVEI